MSRIPYEGAPVSQTPAVSLFFQIATISSFSFNNVNHFTFDWYFKAHIHVYYDSEENWMDRWENYAQPKGVAQWLKNWLRICPPKSWWKVEIIAENVKDWPSRPPAPPPPCVRCQLRQKFKAPTKIKLEPPVRLQSSSPSLHPAPSSRPGSNTFSLGHVS